MEKSDITKALLKYVPVGQPSPGGYITLVQTQVLGVDKSGNPRSTDDLLYFLNVCKRTGLDPLAKQIYAVYRWDYRTGAEKMTIQTSIDGQRLIAQKTSQYGGQDDVKFTPEDESSQYPTKASVTVYRLNPKTGERMPITATARWSEYVQLNKENKPTNMWEKMPYTMLGKCAEALALRKAFPNELSGLYSEEELPKEVLPAPTKVEKEIVKEDKPIEVSTGIAETDLLARRNALKTAPNAN